MNENRHFADIPAPACPDASPMPQPPAGRPVPGTEPWQFAPPPPREPVPAALHDGGLALAMYLAASAWGGQDTWGWECSSLPLPLPG